MASPAAIPNRYVGPMALRNVFHQPLTQSPDLTQIVSPFGIDASQSGVGNPTTVQTFVSPASIKSGQSLGNPMAVQTVISPVGFGARQSVFGNPTTATRFIFTLEPAFFPCINLGWLEGTVQAGNTVVPVSYTNWPDPWDINAKAAVALLDAALLAHPTGNLVVFAHSFGAQIAQKWLREKGPTSTIAASRLSFILTGNPERKYGGTLGMLMGSTSKVQTPGWVGGVRTPPFFSYAINVSAGQNPGVPAGNRYPVTDFARQYDYYADYPSVSNPSYDATANATTTVHMRYFSVTLADPGNVSYGPENNVTYVYSPTHPTTKVGNSWWLSAAQKTAQEAIYRPLIESFYSRPVAIP